MLLRIMLIAAVSFSSFNVSVPCYVMPHVNDARAEVLAVLTKQVQAWNAGDIETYMQGYDQSDSIRFASGGNVQRGWKNVLERYKKSYPNKAAMGTLMFSDLETTILPGDAAIVFGRWKLQRANDEPSGMFTLLFRKTQNGWKIVHDHTSSKER